MGRSLAASSRQISGGKARVGVRKVSMCNGIWGQADMGNATLFTAAVRHFGGVFQPCRISPIAPRAQLRDWYIWASARAMVSGRSSLGRRTA